MVKPRNAKKKGARKEKKMEDEDTPKTVALTTVDHDIHKFSESEITQLRTDLLRWYDKNKRKLPWRTIAASKSSDDLRAYAVLVSELMLQQTQVATVLNYYDKWMTRWPDLPDLAEATLEEVNEMWSGLGYYSRGRRLHEIACKVHKEMDGIMPRTADSLSKLPGVGRYTAGAVASIVFSERAPVVDGNVIRVMARLRAIGTCSTTPAVTKAVWSLAEDTVDPNHPGDFNQAMMELGATICTPKNPQCDSCPVVSLCHADKKAKKIVSKKQLADIEEVPGCNLCLPSEKWDPSLGVMNFPRKEKKTNVSQQETSVCILHRQSEDGLQFFLEKRPKQGLLANLWQFPNINLPIGLSDEDSLSTSLTQLKEDYNMSEPAASFLGRIPHQFSHISQVYVVFSVPVEGDEELSTPAQDQQWVSQSELLNQALPTGMKKVYKLFNSQDTKKEAKKRKPFLSPEAASKKNKLMTDFFKSTKPLDKKC